MSKMKEIDEIAQGIADVTVSGDDYKELHDMVMFLAVEKMYMSIRRKYYECD